MTAPASARAVAIFAPAETDAQSCVLLDEVGALGGRGLLLPLTFSRGRRRLELTVDDAGIVIGERLPPLGAVFLRGLAMSVPAIAPPFLSDVQHAAWRVRYMREQLRQRLLRTVCAAAAAEGALVVNRPETYYHHDTKAQLARALHEAGLPVPRSAGTNDAGALAGFAPGATVFKAGQGVGATRALPPGAPPADRLLDCPALFQERITGPTLRIHTVGDRIVLALRVVASSLDSRSAPERVEVVELGAAEEALLARANQMLGIHYAAWDAILTPGGLVLLDCNPGPYIAWIGERFTRAVLRQVARFLVTHARSGSLEEAQAAVRPVVEPAPAAGTA